MSQKYTRDRTRNLFVDRVKSTAQEHNDAVYNLKAYDTNKADYEGETKNDLVDTIRRAKGF